MSFRTFCAAAITLFLAGCATAAILMLAGCASTTDYHAPAFATTPYPGGAAYADPAAGADAGDGPKAAKAADLGWKNVLGDARLQRLVELALANNRDLRVAVLNVQALKAQAGLQHAAMLPQLGVNASGNANGGGAARNPGRSVNAGLQLNWEADLFGKLGSLDNAAAARYLAGGYARQAAQTLLVAQVADQYYATLAGDEQLALAKEALAAALDAEKIVKAQRDAGVASALDLTLAQTAVEQAQANQAAQLRIQAQAVNALVLLVGAPLPAGLPSAPALADTAIAEVPAGLSSDLLQRRPDIEQAEALLRAGHANIDAARAAFYPSINLTASAGAASSSLAGLFGGGAGLWSFVPSLVAPVFDGGANRARLAQARVQQAIAIATYEKTIQAAFREVSDGLAARGTWDAQVAALARLAATGQQRLALATQAFAAGSGDYLAVLSARTDLVHAQTALVAARQARAASLVDLYRALGGGWLARTGSVAPSPLAAS